MNPYMYIHIYVYILQEVGFKLFQIFFLLKN